MAKNSPRQAACLVAIEKWWADWGKCPTRTELGRALGVCKVSAHLLVKKLERDGRVKTHPGMHRNIEVI